MSRNKANKIICDFHVHTKYSKDSNMDLRLCLKKFWKLGYTHVAITDHNTFNGLRAENYRDINIRVIPGCEIKTLHCEIIALFVEDDYIITHDTFECLDRIHENGGLAVIAHPYRSRYITSTTPKVYNIPEDVLRKVDLIEVVNSRNRQKDNEKCMNLAIKAKKNYIGGSDAHFLFEVGNCRVVYEFYSEDLEEIKRLIVKRKPTIYNYSNTLKNIMANILSFTVKKLRERAWHY